MITIAKVIVDVPSLQTNKTYDYIIPEILEKDITIGFRVRVPFGPRLVLGFIVDIQLVDSSEYTLKPIHSILDTYPVLNAELIQLGDYLSSETFAFKIACYFVMLPAMFKANYKKQVQWLSHTLPLPEFFNGKDTHDLTTFSNPSDIKQLLKWHKEGIVDISDIVEDKVSVKTMTIVELAVKLDDIVVRKGATQQEKLKEALSLKHKITQDELKNLGVTPATIKVAQQKGWVNVNKQRVMRDPYDNQVFHSQPKILNAQQQQVYQTVKDSMLKQKHETFLLEGVTGSGKTEVYLQLIADTIKHGRSALFLVPEIALTPQMVSQFKGRFGNRVAVLHSALTNAQRLDEWTKIRQKQADIVVGARSSVFAPLDNIGVIIIDEEHEATYKQMDTVRYHARDVAIWRGRYHHCPIVLGSATPSLETRARAHKKVYTLLTLTKRANNQDLPDVTIVDMTTEKKNGNFNIFSCQLQQAIQQRLTKKEQVVLLLNRRGYSSFLMCRDCGHVLNCPNCDISLTMHKDNYHMKCHYCGYQQGVPNQCVKCHSDKVRHFGLGTQKVEEELQQLFPEATVIRMDVDTTKQKGGHEKLLKQFEDGKAQILLGTQMIAKGLDFPNITLVGVINADTSLNLPDFRASEKTFQLLTQVAGRAGRGEKTGEVIIQTYNKEHYALQQARLHDYESFYRQEMKMRHIGKYSPYYYMTLITISHHTENLALKTAYDVKTIMQQEKYNSMENTDNEHIIIVGPSAQSIARVNNRYYFQILVKYKNKRHVKEMLDEVMLLAQKVEKKKVYVAIDVEPLNFI